MKDFNRVKVAASLGNHPHGFLMLRFEDFDGGDYDLTPKMDESGLLLPDVQGPRYALSIGGSNPAALERVAKALLTLARKQREAAGESPSDTNDGADEA